MFFSVESTSNTELDLRLKPVASTIRSTVEEVGSSWLKDFSSRKLNSKNQTATTTNATP